MPEETKNKKATSAKCDYCIVVAGDAFLVNEKELAKLQKAQGAIEQSDFPDCERLSEELSIYLDKSKLTYKQLGPVWFDHRR